MNRIYKLLIICLLLATGGKALNAQSVGDTFTITYNEGEATAYTLTFKLISNVRCSIVKSTNPSSPTTLKIPSTVNGPTYAYTAVQAIEDYAFHGCSGFTGSLNTNAVRTIGKNAFSECSGFNGSLEIEKFVTSIGDNAFYGCSGFTSLTIESGGVTSIEKNVFQNCSGITSLTIPNSVATIGDYAFYGCSSITSLTIPNSVTSIGKNAFQNCSGITLLSIPNNVTSIGDDAFYGCSGLNAVASWAETAPTLGSDVFANINENATLYYPASCEQSYAEKSWFEYFSKHIGVSGKCGDHLCWSYDEETRTLTISGNGAMYDYTKAENMAPWRSLTPAPTSLVLCEGVTSIGKYAFYECVDLTGDLIIPNSVTSIEDNSFSGCSGFNDYDLILGKNVSVMDIYAFWDFSFANVYSFSKTAPQIEGTTFDTDHTSTLYYPASSYESYQDNGWFTEFKKVNDESTIEINSKEDFITFTTIVNLGYTDVNAIFNTDIDLEGEPWTPISDYAGTFDGNGHTISGFNMNITSEGRFGFFSNANNATIKNFTIDGNVTSNMKADGSFIYGSIVAWCEGNTNISNVRSLVNFTSVDSFKKEKVGGLVGHVEADILNMDRCTYSGVLNVGAAKVDYIGGIISHIKDEKNITITNSSFDGKILSSNEDSAEDDHIGGFIGYYNGQELTIKNSLSVGEITLPTDTVYYFMVGAFMGILRNHEEAMSMIKNNYYKSGTVCGQHYQYDDELYEEELYGCAHRVTVEKLGSGSIAYWLNGSTNEGDLAWGQNLDNGETPDAYPVVGAAPVYYYNSVYTNDISFVGGRCGDNLYWQIKNDTLLRIYGTGDMYEGAPYKNYVPKDKLLSIVIEEGVTSIGNFAFALGGGSDYEIRDIIIPNSVTSIGEGAFTDLIIHSPKMIIGRGVTEIDNLAFQEVEVNEIYFYNNDRIQIAERAFLNTNMIDNIYFPTICEIVGIENIPEGERLVRMPTWTSEGWVFPEGQTELSENDHVAINVPLVLGQQQTANSLSVKSFGYCGNATTTNGNIIIEDGGYLYCEDARGEVTVKKEILGYQQSESGSESESKWYTIASPLKETVSNSSFLTANTDLYRYDEPTHTWQNAKNSEANGFNSIEPGRGYLYANADDTTLEFTGMINTDDVTYNLTAEGEILKGFHLVGNPFTHDITFAHLNADVDLAEGYYVLDGEGAWGARLGSSAEDVIKVGQAALIKTTAEGTLAISRESSAVRHQQSRNGQQPIANRQQLKLTVSNGKHSDRAFVVFDKGVGLDKMNHENKNIPLLYIPMEDADYAIAMMDMNVNEIHVNFETNVMGEYTISLRQENCEFEELYLYDKVNDVTVNILENDYTFIATSSENPERFVLLKKANGQQPTADSHFAYISNNDIVIYNIEGNADIRIFDVMGRCVYNGDVSAETSRIATADFANGIYMIQKTDDNGINVQKIVL